MRLRSALLCLVCCGCGTSSAPLKQAPLAVQPSSSETIKNPASIAPRHPRVELSINNHRYGETNGCTTTFAPQRETTGGLTCGHPGAVSRLTWTYLRSDDNGDHYDIERVFPHGEPNQQATRKEIVFADVEMMLFEDEYQRVYLRAGLPPMADKAQVP